MRHRHLEWLITLAERLSADPFDRAAIGQLARERANIDAALTWAVEAERAEDGLRLCTSSGPTGSSLVTTGCRSWLTKLRAAVTARADPRLLARAALQLGGLADLSSSNDGVAELRRARRLARAAGDPAIERRAAHWLGEAYLRTGKARRARAALETAARLHADARDTRAAGVRARLSIACLGVDDQTAAEAHARTALELAQTTGHPWELARAWHAIGVLSVARGEPGRRAPGLRRATSTPVLASTPACVSTPPRPG